MPSSRFKAFWVAASTTLAMTVLWNLPVHAQEKDATTRETDPNRPPAILAEEVPVVPAEIFSRLQRYNNVRAASFAGWAPDCNGIMIRTRFGNTVQLHRVFEPGGRRQQITFFEEPAEGFFLPQNKDNAMLLSLSQGGSEQNQIYVFNPKTDEINRLTDGKSRNGINAISEDGQQVVISSNARNGKDTDLYLCNPAKPDSLELFLPTDGEYWYAADWSPDGNTLLLGRYVSINESYFALFDLESRTKTDLPLPDTKEGFTTAIGDLAFSPDGKKILLSSDAGSEFRRLAEFDLASKEYRWITKDIDWDVSDLVVDSEHNLIVFAVNEDGASKLFQLKDGKPQPLEIPLGIVSKLEFSPDGKELGMTLSRPDAPSDAFSLNLATNELTRWTFSEVGGLNPEKFIKPSRISFKSFDDRKIPAYYYRPNGASKENPAAVLINIHGGPESQYRPYFSSSAQFYANELGLAVIYPNVRGSSGYGKTYVALDNGMKREESVQDIGALLDWIEAQPELDASRVAVAGGSYGDYMVLSSLVNYPKRIQAGVDVVGVANFITFLENTADYRRDLRRAEYGDERDPKMRAYFEKINPTAHADKIESALLVAHGVNDPRVPFSEAEQIAEVVRKQGREVWTVFAENEGHGFGKKDNYDYLRGVQVLFFKEHLSLEWQKKASPLFD
jgi:dipeptidyl aminopeptidase/acylaminoacyl peptidase